MATRTKSLVSAATLASAAAVAVAGTAIAPSVTVPTPHALSAAKVQLATFADVLSIPAAQWTDLLFGNTEWGNVLSSENYGDESAKPQEVFLQPGYVNPWATYCDGGCVQTGFSAVAYLFFDALVNGNGEGWDNVDKWNTGIVNYFFEPEATFVIGGGQSPSLQFVNAGFSAATWYLLQTTIGKAIPELTIPIAAPFWGPDNVSVAYNLILTGVAQALNTFVPVIGPITGNSILAYLGDLEIPNSGGLTYQYGPSGTLNYWIDILTGSAPFPTATTLTTRTTAAAVAAPAADAVAAPADATVDETKVDEASEGTEASDTKAAPEVTVSESADEASEAKGAESTEASESTEAPAVKPVEAPAPEVKDTAAVDEPAPAKPSRPRPVRDAVEKVGQQINSAINDAKAKQAERAAARKAAKATKADSAS